jgi:hypothetical protein
MRRHRIHAYYVIIAGIPSIPRPSERRSSRPSPNTSWHKRPRRVSRGKITQCRTLHSKSNLLVYSSNVLAKLLLFAFLVAVVPIATYFTTIKHAFDGE